MARGPSARRVPTRPTCSSGAARRPCDRRIDPATPRGAPDGAVRMRRATSAATTDGDARRRRRRRRAEGARSNPPATDRSLRTRGSPPSSGRCAPRSSAPRGRTRTTSASRVGPPPATPHSRSSPSCCGRGESTSRSSDTSAARGRTCSRRRCSSWWRRRGWRWCRRDARGTRTTARRMTTARRIAVTIPPRVPPCRCERCATR